jgi:hypothetical protein
MYFAGRHKNVSSSRPGWCIGVATSLSPNGPFNPRSTPLFCRVNSSSATPASFSNSPAQDRGAIDPQVFRAPNGNLILYFKALNNLYQIWGVRLTADGLNRSGPGYGLLPIDSQARVWEYSSRLHFTVLENPNMVFNPSPGVQRRYVLTYAGGEWQRPSNYGTGYALCSSPLGGCARQTRDRPWLYSRGSSWGPGAASTFTGPDNAPWLAFHTYEAGHVMDGNGRRLHVEPLRFAGSRPTFNNRRPTGTFNATSPAAGQVTLSGTADDADTGRPVLVQLREDGAQFATRITGPGVNWSLTINRPSASSHRYCAIAVDDNGAAGRTLGCADVVVA